MEPIIKPGSPAGEPSMGLAPEVPLLSQISPSASSPQRRVDLGEDVSPTYRLLTRLKLKPAGCLAASILPDNRGPGQAPQSPESFLQGSAPSPGCNALAEHFLVGKG